MGNSRTFLTAIAVALCIFGHAEARQPEGAQPGGSLYYTRVLVEPNCIFAANLDAPPRDQRALPLAGLLMSVVGPLISSGIDLVVARIQRIREEYSASESALGRGLFYDWEKEAAQPLNHCVTLVRGAFGGARNDAAVNAWASELLVASGGSSSRTVEVQAGVAELGLAGRPDLFAEFHIVYSKTPGAFEIVPKLIDFHRPLAKRSGSKGKLVTFAFRFDAVAPGDRGSTFASTALPPIRLFGGSIYRGQALSGLTTGYNAAPARAAISDGAGGSVLSPTPFNIIATICEAEEPSVLAQLLANSAAAIGENLKPQLIGAAAKAFEGDKENKTKESVAPN